MKKRIFSSLVAAVGICMFTFAQTVQENELAVVYYMPLTQLAVTIDYEKITVEPGPFYLYAERYLGVKDVTTEASARYEVSDIHVTTHTVADVNRAYKVIANGENAQWLSLTPEGLLHGYNVPAYVGEEKQEESTSDYSTPLPKLMPLMEEQMVASSIAKMAEGAAKQIYHIREMRINLLAGDVEHTPSDGKAMQLVLDELNKREQMLAELFIGTRTVEQYSHTIYYVPGKDVKDRIIGRVSQYSGIVQADDLSGEPIRLSLAGKRQTYMPMDEKAAKQNKSAIPSQLYYNLPGSARVVVEFGEDVRTSATLPIAQFGVAIPLAKDLLQGKKTPHIYFNTQTGNILSIQQ